MQIYLQEVAIGGRLELISDIAAPDMVDEANTLFGGPAGRAGLVAHVRGFRKNVLDCQIEVLRIVGDAEAAMGWWTFSGQHIGPWLGKAATHDVVSGSVTSQFDATGGLIRRYRLCLFAEFSDSTAFFDTASGTGPRFL